MNKYQKVLLVVLLLGFGVAFAPIWFQPGVGYGQIKKSLERRGPTGKIIAPINAFDEDGVTGLIKYATEGKPNIVQLFIDHGAKLDLRSMPTEMSQQSQLAGSTALMYAIKNGNIPGTLESAQKLVDAGANVNAVGSERRRPIHYLGWIQFSNTHTDRMQAADILIEKFAFVNAQNEDGNTMLHLMVYQNAPQWIEDFKKKYNSWINWKIKNNKGLTVWQLAKSLSQVGDGTVGAAIQTKVPVVGDGYLGYLDTDSFKRNGLMYAILRDDMPFVKKMLQAGIKVNAQSAAGNTALHFAALSFNPISFIKLLLEKNANPNIQNNKGDTPIMYLLHMDKSKQAQAAQLFLNNGANLKIKNKQGKTILTILKDKNETSLLNYIQILAAQLEKEKPKKEELGTK